MEASLSFELLHLWVGNVGEAQLVGSHIYICFSDILLGAPKKKKKKRKKKKTALPYPYLV